MARLARVIFLLVGIGLLAILVTQVDLAAVRAYMREMGWVFPLIFLPYHGVSLRYPRLEMGVWPDGLERWRPHLGRLDETIAGFDHRHPRHLVLSLLFHILGWLLGGLEVYAIFYAVG